MKNYNSFYLKTHQFLEVKFSIYLNRRVFVIMCLLSVKEYTLKGKKCFPWKPYLFFFRVDRISGVISGAICSGRKTRRHKSCFPYKVTEYLPSVFIPRGLLKGEYVYGL